MTKWPSGANAAFGFSSMPRRASLTASPSSPRSRHSFARNKKEVPLGERRVAIDGGPKCAILFCSISQFVVHFAEVEIGHVALRVQFDLVLVLRGRRVEIAPFFCRKARLKCASLRSGLSPSAA